MGVVVVIVIVIIYLYSGTSNQCAFNPGQCLHCQVGRYSDVCDNVCTLLLLSDKDLIFVFFVDLMTLSLRCIQERKFVVMMCKHI